MITRDGRYINWLDGVTFVCGSVEIKMKLVDFEIKGPTPGLDVVDGYIYWIDGEYYQVLDGKTFNSDGEEVPTFDMPKERRVLMREVPTFVSTVYYKDSSSKQFSDWVNLNGDWLKVDGLAINKDVVHSFRNQKLIALKGPV